MRLSSIENGDAIDLLAEIIEPMGIMLADSEVKKLYRCANKAKLAKHVLKTYKAEIIEVLAALDGVPVADYKTNIIKMTKDIIDLLNDKELIEVFQSQEQNEAVSAFGPATETTEASETK